MSAAPAAPAAPATPAAPAACCCFLAAFAHTVFLSHHLTKVTDCPNQIYVLKWVRLLLAREFRITDTIKIWDYVVARLGSGKEWGNVMVPVPTVVENLVLACILSYRAELLAGDCNDVLTLLMKYEYNGGRVERLLEVVERVGGGEGGDVWRRVGGGQSQQSQHNQQRVQTAPQTADGGNLFGGVKEWGERVKGTVETIVRDKSGSMPGWLMGRESESSVDAAGSPDLFSPKKTSTEEKESAGGDDLFGGAPKPPVVKSSTLGFLMGDDGKDGERAEKTRAVFGTFDDSESDNDDIFARMEEKEKEVSVLEAAIQKVAVEEVVEEARVVEEEAAQEEAAQEEAVEDAREVLEKALKTLNSYLQDEGAGAPPTVWKALADIARVKDGL